MNGRSGRIEDGRHVLDVRVYYEDTDAAGMVYYANYLKFAERARTEMLRLVGVDHGALSERYGLAFVVRGCTLSFQRPARLDDLVEVRSRLLALGGASLEAEQAICRGESELARLDVRLACTTPDGRASRIPAPVREALLPYCREAPGDQPEQRD